MKILVFGAGAMGREYASSQQGSDDISIEAFLDNDAALHGRDIDGIAVRHPEAMRELDFEKVVIAVGAPQAIKDIYAQLKSAGTPSERIDIFIPTPNIYNEYANPRVRWLRSFAELARARRLTGSVAECGVFRGDFAEYINKYFFGRTVYLFDSFEGFRDEDREFEAASNDPNFQDSIFAKGPVFTSTSLELVASRLKKFDKCLIIKGYFPESAFGVNDRFCFVNLDMDLYKPTLAALDFFWEKMTPGGVILLHDYFLKETPGVKAAVDDFEKSLSRPLTVMPIGDSISLAIIKGDE